MPDTELQTDVLIVGGGTGGVAAALAVARGGGRCVVTEPTDWVGGQLTSQGVPPDENRWIEGKEGIRAATASYLDLRNRVRAFYRDHRRLNAVAANDPYLNPGNGWVSRLCCEPRIVHAVLREMLEPHIAAGRITLLLRHEPVAADVGGDRVNSVTLQNLDTGDRVTITAEYFLDATEFGDLYPLAKVEYHVGAEASSVFNELHGRPDRSDPNDQQAVTWCFAVEHRPGEDHTIARPERYDFFRQWTPKLDRPWPGKLFSWTVSAADGDSARTFRFLPWPDEPAPGEFEMWRYRRIVDRGLYEQGIPAPPDVSLINMVQTDYFLLPLLDVTPEERLAALADARQQSLSFLYWMQTEAPRHDGGTGYPGLKLRGEELGTTDGFAKAVYVREPRRLAGRRMVTEGDVGTDQRKKQGKMPRSPTPWGMAEPFADSVGVGHYRLDLHPSTAMRNSLYVNTAPFRIPMGALIPKRVRNVLAAGKGIGVTHVTNGCYRLHPIEWNAGEAAGALAAHCLGGRCEPAGVHESAEETRAFQRKLVDQGFVLAWPWENGAGLG